MILTPQAGGEQVERIVQQMAAADDTDEQLKATNLLRRIGLMNNYRRCVEEVMASKVFV